MGDQFSGFVNFGETLEKQADGSYKRVKITRAQCAECKVIGWTTLESIYHERWCRSGRRHE